MTLILYIVRHAEADEKSSGITDLQRELNTNGLRQATYVGQYLRKHKANPDIIICSPAIRALTTATIIAEQLDKPPEKIIQKDNLYEASVRNLLQLVNVLQASWKKVVLVAHNPGLHYFVEYITGDVLTKLEPSGLVEISFELTDWEIVIEKSGSLGSYYVPESKTL